MSERLLVVDDEKAILISFQQMLRSPTLHVDTAETIEDAERLLKENVYRAVIADLRLTGILGEEGLELIRYVRDQNLDTRVLLVTGYGSPEIKEKALGLGAAGYFEKPVDIKLLRSALSKLGAA
jgi:DNA-binding NtrC family response regulator